MINNLSLEEIQQNIKSFMESCDEYDKNRIRVVVTPKKVIEQTTIAPTFFHSEIDHLYQYGYEIPLHYIDEIKALPRETLIKDLNAVIYDSIARFDIFNSDDWDHENGSWFHLHALFVLRDIQAEESLEVILDFLSQDEDLVEYWTGDILTEDFWAIIAMCGKNNLDRLSSFLKETGRYIWARAAVSEAVNQLAQHDIIPKQAAIDWLGDLLKYYLENQQTENLIDSDLNGLLIAMYLDLEAKELSPLVQQMFEAQIVDETCAGNWEEVKKRLDKSLSTSAKREINSIEQLYEVIKKASACQNLNQNGHYDERYRDEDYNIKPIIPHINNTLKIGRNDLCPCDSGKKYKKCHGVD